ncbi:MAG: hypothetical protein ACK56F_32370 [bacterium]
MSINYVDADHRQGDSKLPDSLGSDGSALFMNLTERTYQVLSF